MIEFEVICNAFIFICDVCKMSQQFPSIQAAYDSGWITRNAKDYCCKRCRDADPPEEEG